MRRLSLLALGAICLAPIGSSSAPTARGVADYKYFRALTIDLLGRAPSRDEIATFERPDFQLDAWIDAHLKTGAYADRFRRVYLDLLKLELPWSVGFQPEPVLLKRQRLLGPDGQPFELYFRQGQRRATAAIDGDMCFTEAESGIKVPRGGAGVGQAIPIDQATLDARTVLVKPWWLYADYRAKDPQDRAGPHWQQTFPGYQLALQLFHDLDGQPTRAIRVCREEAQTSPQGRAFVAARLPLAPGSPFPAGRLSHQPPDLPFAHANRGKPVSCLDQTGFQTSHECGCGVGLERCIPHGPNGFTIPVHSPLGIAQTFNAIPRPAQMWLREWWSEEASRFIGRIFEEDRDVRELLTSRSTVVNGPLAQFYGGMANATCCRGGLELGYAQAQPLFEPTHLPKHLTPQQTSTWVSVDRGKRAAGLMTMPVFLKKYATRRARAHVLYQAFLCRDFVAPAAKLAPSDEPDLAKRPGCAACHRTLEPMAAYFARVQESDWTYLPPQHFPLQSTRCGTGDPAGMPFACKSYYDPAFTTARGAELRGAHGSFANADAGPAGLATEITSRPEFASCVVQNIAQSLLGRSLDASDEAWKQALAQRFVDGGYRLRGLVKAVVTSAQYRDRPGAAP